MLKCSCFMQEGMMFYGWHGLAEGKYGTRFRSKKGENVEGCTETASWRQRSSEHHG